MGYSQNGSGHRPYHHRRGGLIWTQFLLVMEGEDIIEVEYCMSELVDMALGQRIEPVSLDLSVECWKWSIRLLVVIDI